MLIHLIIILSRSSATKVCLLLQNNSAVQSQNAVLSSLQVSRYCLLDFHRRILIRVGLPLIALIFHDTMCVQELQAYSNVYFSGGQMLAAMAQTFTTFRPTGTSDMQYIYDIGLSHKILF